MHLHCTQKLLKSFVFPKDSLDSTSPSNRLFGWHAHIVSIARAKTIIALNDQTFFAVIIPGIKKERLENFSNEFYLALSSVLKSEGLGDPYLDVLFGEHISYEKAHDRQVIGIINQVVKDIDYRVAHKGGWEKINIIELTKSINRTPWLASTSNPVFPIERITSDLKSLLH